MTPKPPGPNTTGITELLGRSSRGDLAARDRVITRLVDEIRRFARFRLSRAWGRQTTTPDELITDVYLKVFEAIDQNGNLAQVAEMPEFKCRLDFLFYLSKAMWHILMDQSRHQRTKKAGGTWMQVTPLQGEAGERDLMESIDASLGTLQFRIDLDYVMLNQAVESLPKDLRTVVELKYWLGMTDPEAAAELGLTASRVQSLWKRAKARLEAHFGVADKTGSVNAKTPTDRPLNHPAACLPEES